MLTREARGTKRTCQNAECGSRFYDLNRDQIFCPICGFEYRLAPEIIDEEVLDNTHEVEAVGVVPSAMPMGDDVDGGDGEEVSDDDALVSLEDADAEIEGGSSDADDNAFLEEDDDGDMSDIIVTSVNNEDDGN
ncbi:MAG: hypothetical protein TECD_01003 [Hyphomicrobiaceae bacterium hypho_1]